MQSKPKVEFISNEHYTCVRCGKHLNECVLCPDCFPNGYGGDE